MHTGYAHKPCVAWNMFRTSTTIGSANCASNVLSAHDVLVELVKMVTAFPDLLLFTRIVLTIPIASASAERSFSTMKRVKMYLRSTMIDGRLNDLCMLAIERELSHELLIDPIAVLDKFAKLAERRVRFLK